MNYMEATKKIGESRKTSVRVAADVSTNAAASRGKGWSQPPKIHVASIRRAKD